MFGNAKPGSGNIDEKSEIVCLHHGIYTQFSSCVIGQSGFGDSLQKTLRPLQRFHRSFVIVTIGHCVVKRFRECLQDLELQSLWRPSFKFSNQFFSYPEILRQFPKRMANH